jgi:hypothetical protein
MAELKNNTKIGVTTLAEGAVGTVTLPSLAGRLFTATTATTNYYVDVATGNDANDGSIGSKFATIQHAINLVPKYLEHNVTINVTNGTYPESLVVNGFLGGYGTLKITGSTIYVNNVTAYGNTGNVVLKGLRPTTTSDVAFDLWSNTNTMLDSCVTTVSATSYIGVEVWEGHVHMVTCTIQNRQRGVFAGQGALVTMEDSSVSSCTTGLYAYGAGIIAGNCVPTSCTTAYAIAYGGVIIGSMINPAPTDSPTFTGTVTFPATTTMLGATNLGTALSGAITDIGNLTYSQQNYIQNDESLTDSVNKLDIALKANEMSLTVALSDETTAITTGTAKVTIRMPIGCALTRIPRASLSTASTSGLPAIDINKNGSSIFSTTLTIDANEKTSVSATTAAVMTSTPYNIADDDEITFDIDTAGTGAKGLKVTLYYKRA